MSAPPDRPLTRRELREAAAQRAAELRPAEEAAAPAPDGAEHAEPEAPSDEAVPDEKDAGSDDAPAEHGDAPLEGEAPAPSSDEDAPDPEPEAPEPEPEAPDEGEPEPDGPAEAETATTPVATTPDGDSSGAAERPEPVSEDVSTVVLPATRRRRDVAASEPPPPSRAGRNLPVATGVGLGLGGLLLISLFIRPEAFVVLAVIAAGGGLWEFAVALRSKNIRIPLLPLLVGSTGMLVSAYVAGPEALVVAFMLTAGGVFVWRVIDGGGMQALRDAGAGILAAAYIPFLTSFAVLMIAAPDGAWRVLYAISLVVANDVGGYAAGVLFGRHPMAPTISPKKSWEGAAGSVVLAAVVGVGLMWWFFDGPLWTGALIGLFAVAAATVGDLSESLIKRDLGLKDMGTLLPGHGGILDRLDSMLVASPVVYGSLTLALAFAA